MKILLKGRNMRTFPERRAASGLLSEKKEFEVEGLPFVRPAAARPACARSTTISASTTSATGRATASDVGKCN
jgi:hypothetical protein